MTKIYLLFAGFLLSCNVQAQMAVDFDWKLEHRCSTVSPTLLVSGAPSGTAKFVAKMIDNDMPSYPHGGGSVEATNLPNMEIPPGSLKDYKGPCPPNFNSFGHDYSWSVQALDAAGQVLGSATNTKTFSSAKVPK